MASFGGGGRGRAVWVVGPLSTVPTGAQRVTHRVRDGVAAAGGARIVEVDTGDEGGDGGRVKLVRRIGRMLGGLARLAVARRRSGTVYIAGAGGEVLWYQAAVVLLARVAGLRTVFHHHSYYYLTATRAPMRAISRIGGARLTHVVLCEGMGTVLSRRYPSVTDVVVCSNAGLLAEADGASRAPLPVLTVGHLSNLTIEKGVGEVLATLRLLRERGHDARLVLAGPATTPEVQALVAEAQAEHGDALTVLGQIAPDTVDDFYAQIDVFLFPSRYAQEAEPLVVLDASRNGVATLAYGIGCLPGMVAPEHTVPLDADFAHAAVKALTEADLPTAQSVAATFAQRRAEAVDAHEALVTSLLG